MAIYIATIGAPAEISIEKIDSDPYIVEITEEVPATIHAINQSVLLEIGSGNCTVDFNQLNLGTDVIGILPIIHGGTGSDTGSINAPGPITLTAVGDISLQPSGDLVIKDLTGILRADNGVISIQGGTGAVSAADVAYTHTEEPTLTNVKEALDSLIRPSDIEIVDVGDGLVKRLIVQNGELMIVS